MDIEITDEQYSILQKMATEQSISVNEVLENVITWKLKTLTSDDWDMYYLLYKLEKNTGL